MEIWYSNVDELSTQVSEALISQLPQFMYREVSEFRNAEDRKCRLVARLIVKEYCLKNGYLKRWYDWSKTNSGKPCLPGGPFFSISHSGNMVVVAFDNDHEIGVDIEQLSGFDIAEVLPFFHPDEISWLSGMEYDMQEFYNIWTRKEALYKASGKGLSEHLDQVSVLSNEVWLEELWAIRSVEIAADFECSVCHAVIHNDAIIHKVFYDAAELV